MLAMGEKKEYPGILRCKNCGCEIAVSVPWGTKVAQVATEYKEKCQFCGVCDWEKGRRS